jgi:ABC-type hemin transport system substrate-binding protein
MRDRSVLIPSSMPGPTRRSLLAFLSLSAASFCVGACSKHEPKAVARESDRPGAPLRIVALSPASAVIARDLGLQSSIVGRHAFDLVLDPSVPVCGDQNGIDYEALIRVRPTHVFLEWGSREPPVRLREFGARERWSLHNFSTLTLRDVRGAVDALDRATRNADASAELSEHARTLLARLDALIDPSPNATRASNAERVLMLIGTAPPGALGPGSCHHELLLALGATPAITTGGAFQELTHEDLVRLAPGAIILFLPRSQRAGTESGMTPLDDPWAPLRGLKLPALEQRRVAIIDDPLCLLPASSLVGVADEMRDAMREWEPEKPTP